MLAVFVACVAVNYMSFCVSLTMNAHAHNNTHTIHCESGRNKSIGCFPTHGDVGELFPGECGRPVANNPPPHPRKHGRRRRGPQMSDKKGRCCRCNGGKMRRFCFSLLTPQNQGEKKNKETLGRKQSVALRGALLPLVLPQRSM